MRHTSDPELDEQLRLLGESLRIARRRAGLTQVELAAAAELDRAAIGFLERAERAPELSTLLRVGRALDLEPAELLRGVEARGDAALRGRDAAGTMSGRTDGAPRNSAAQFGVALRAARVRAGVSQQTLALRADVDRAAISVYERGARAPNMRTVLKLARALSLSPATLLEGIGIRVNS